jgi:peptidoglycan/xylan/chitin deacetylase (PgdA/CDA1 family)
MSIQDGLRVIAAAFDAHVVGGQIDWTASMPDLVTATVARATAQGPVYHLPPCGLHYTQANQEIRAWHLCILLGEYVAGLLALKGVEAGCHTAAHAPCGRASDLHLRMLQDFKRDLERLVHQIDDLREAVKSNPERGVPRAQDLELRQ